MKAAFTGESQAIRRYLALTKKTDEEKLLNVAKFFRAAAKAETVHVLNTYHLLITGEIERTRSNQNEAISG